MLAEKKQTIDVTPKPFVKWAGGKRQLINLLIDNAPTSFGRYFEPFVGGGALLFALLPSAATITDANPELINAYQIIRDELPALMKDLARHRNDEEYFYAIRAKQPARLSAVKRASRFLYLNKTCFNGLYRENSKGEFNAPFGKYVNPKILDQENLTAVSAYLNDSDVAIYHRDYKAVLDEARPGDFVYFDPPYYPLTQTASFTKYVGADFGPDNQQELAAVFGELARRNVYVMLSNSNTEFIKNLYQGHRIQQVAASRAINCKGSKRGKELNEVLVRSW